MLEISLGFWEPLSKKPPGRFLIVTLLAGVAQGLQSYMRMCVVKPFSLSVKQMSCHIISKVLPALSLCAF